MSSTAAIARLTPQQSTYDYFRTHHLLANEPCLFPPALVDDWPLFPLWFARTPPRDSAATEIEWDYLLEQYGDLEVTCIDCTPRAGSDPSGEQVEVKTFGALIDLWRVGKGRTLYLKDWHLPLAIQRSESSVKRGKRKLEEELYRVEDVCLDDWMNEFEGRARTDAQGRLDDFRFVYAGGKDTFTPLHRDVYCSYSISSQLHGRKLWYLFPPSCTADLEPFLARARLDESLDGAVNCDSWPEDVKAIFRARGMLEVTQEPRETIFIPSGWYHSVHNLTHPTFSLNHNWSNSHNLPQIYESLSAEVTRCREAISDVKELLVDKARREGTGEAGWEREWEESVDGLVELSEGWSWRTFWRMTLNSLEALALSDQDLKSRFDSSRWPLIPPSARPPIPFVLAQVRPLVQDFLNRPEQEWRWLDGLEQTVRQAEAELERLSVAG
ncbi:hypothetical protein JCM10212_000903 [Sporobolomyces blumeae]